jgi:RNA-directed DNA polymerase
MKTMAWLGMGCSDGKTTKRRDLLGVCEPNRSQSPHSTAVVGMWTTRSPGSKTGLRDGGQEGGCVTNEPRQQSAASAATAMQGAEAAPTITMIPGAEAGVWTERMVSALVNGVKGGKWFSLMDKVFAPKTLALAWAKVRANKGVAGVDGQSIERFTAQSELYLAELSAALRDGVYVPQAVKRVDIPKDDGRTRPLGIPTVKDRIVQQAVRLVIEPIFEHGFAEGSFGFRPQRGCHDALREVDGLIKDGYTFVVDADLQAYFDTIPHAALMERVEEKVSDGRVLDLIRGWLKADIMKGADRWTPVQGSPQGAVISPLLANIYLDPLDKLMAALGFRMVRYADDFVILCRNHEDASAALAEVQVWVSANGLTLHPEKTHVGDCRVPGQGFEFLGYRFEAGQRHVRKKSLTKLKDSIRAKTGRSRGDSLKGVIADLNPSLRGWFGYFKHAHCKTFGMIDGFVRRRLRALLRKQQKRPGMGLCRADHQRWPNAFFANAGLFALNTAWQIARQPR